MREYLRENGSSPYQEWFDDLDVQAAAKITAAKARLETRNTSAVRCFRGIGEYVIDWGGIGSISPKMARKKALGVAKKR